MKRKRRELTGDVNSWSLNKKRLSGIPKSRHSEFISESFHHDYQPL